MAAMQTGPAQRAYTVAGTLSLSAPQAPSSLVSAGAWRTVGAACALLPAALTRAVYLECRLREGAEQVDLVLKVEEPGRAILAGENPVFRLPGALLAEPAWQRVADLCSRWGEAGSLLRRVVDHLWLELDLPPGGEPGGVPCPSVFVALSPAASTSLAAGEWKALLAEVGGVLLPGRADPAASRAAGEVLARRPHGTSVPYLGWMLSRPRQALRIYLRGLGAAGFRGYLREVGWPGDGADLPAAAEEASRPAVGMVHVDVAGEVLPRVGIEYTLSRPPQLRGRVAEEGFLQELVAAGLCTAEKRDGLLAWPGWQRRTLPHELWESVLVRRVNCVKVVHDSGGVEAKGYLLAFHVPAPPRGRAPEPRVYAVEAGLARDLGVMKDPPRERAHALPG